MLLSALPACRTEQTLVEPRPYLERMEDQAKRLPYEDDPVLPLGMEMQKPPLGTLPVDTSLEGPLVERGAVDGRWADRIPVAIDRAVVERGRSHFETFCAPCHGELGDGHSAVADHMGIRKPQDLLSDRVRAFPPGRVFRTVRDGYGLMPPYRAQLGVKDTWAVVAYVQALQAASGVRVADLPASARTELRTVAP
jgi:mono/diheme cytochrome c family protein